MRKLLVRCACGQEMQVPRSAFGKSGMCSACGATVRIGTDNTRPFATATPGGTNAGGGRPFGWRRGGPSEEAKQRFGQAVDLYTAHRYAEALAIFDSLSRDFPDNPEIEQARSQCMRAMSRTTLPAPDQVAAGSSKLDEDTVKQVLLNKMLHGSTDGIQLQAAELAARVLGIMPDRGKKPAAAPGEPDGADGGSNGFDRAGQDVGDHEEINSDAVHDRDEID